jgi:hypothetical protein
LIADEYELTAIAREEALRAGRAAPVLHGLARADWRWLMDHAVPIVEGTPKAAAELLLQLNDAGQWEDIGVIGAMVARVPGIDVKKFRKQVRIFFEGRDRRKILSGLPPQY